MRFRDVPRRIWRGRIVTLALVIAVVYLLMQLGEWLTAPPRTQAEAEAHLDRSIIAYALWDDTPWIVFEFGGKVHFDRLRIDLVSIDWPPGPRWQWTGNWWTIDSITDPASVALASTRHRSPVMSYDASSDGDRANDVYPVIYGQVNAPEIAWLEVRSDGEWFRYPVSAPGFAIRLAADQPYPREYRWLDADGAVIWSVDRDAERRSSPTRSALPLDSF